MKCYLCQASCGRMGREKIEDLVCAPHLSYTQQVHLKDLASRFTQIDRKEHSRELWRRTQTKHRLIKGHRQKYIKDISVHELICHPISDWGFLLASFDQQECWGGNDYNHNYTYASMDCWQSWYKLQAKLALNISLNFWQFCPDDAVKY